MGSGSDAVNVPLEVSGRAEVLVEFGKGHPNLGGPC